MALKRCTLISVFLTFTRGSGEMESTHIIDPHGGYRRLKSYQMAEIVYDATVHFCDR